MTTDIILVLSISGGAILLFLTNKVRMDLVGLLVLGSLAISGIISPTDALSGFSNPAVITVWAVLILSGGLARTGVASKLGKFLLQMAGDSEWKLMAIIMITSGILSGFMNSIGVASLFLPVVIDISRRTNRPPSRFLIPLAFSALLGGLNTLIGTPPNILISESLREAGLAPFQMFDFTPVGLTLLFAGTLYMVLIGRHLLPKRDITKDLGKNIPDVSDVYDFQERMAFIRLPDESSLDGKTLQESRLGAALELNVVSIFRNEQSVMAPKPDFILQSGDRLLVEGQLDHLSDFYEHNQHFLDQKALPVEKIYSAKIKLAEIEISPGSSLIGLTLPQAAFRHVYKVIVLAIRKPDNTYYDGLECIPIRAGDKLLIKGQQPDLDSLQHGEDLELSILDSYSDYQIDDNLMMVRVPPGSVLVGKTLVSSRLGDAFGLSVQGIVRNNTTELMPQPDERLQAEDTLILKGNPETINTIQGLQDLVLETQTQPDLYEL